jgi:3-deoxy-D-manno-octulosonic-acid transferase
MNGGQMRLVYTILLYLALPFALARLYVRGFKSPAYRLRWRERLGFLPDIRLDQSIWIHSVSVGETQAAQPLVNRLLEQYPQYSVVITTTTPTGAERVKSLFGGRVRHLYLPYDLPFAIRHFMESVRPRLAIFMETEVWPNLLMSCEREGVRTILANARLSERSATRYARFTGFARETFARIDVVAAQTQADAERFLGFGVDPSRVSVTGSIKFDIRLPASLYEHSEVIRRQWEGRPVWVAASTHEGEDEQVIAAHREILRKFPRALLVLVPRHPERFDRVAALCQKEGMSTVRRSEAAGCGPETQVFLGDTMGELVLFLAASDLAFVGGSLVPVGGHNVLEPAALGVPVLFGPHMFNFQLISRMLLAAGAAREVDSTEQLAAVVCEWFADASLRAGFGESGSRLVGENRGALDRLCQLIESQFDSPGE